MYAIKQFLEELGHQKMPQPPNEEQIERNEVTSENSQLEVQAIVNPIRNSKAFIEITEYVKILTAKKIDITKEHYQRVKIGEGLANSFGEEGRELFYKIISAGEPNFDEKKANDLFSESLLPNKLPRLYKPTAATVLRLLREGGAHRYKLRRRRLDENPNEVAFEIIVEKYPAVFDSLSQDVLVNGKPIDDTILNTIYVDLLVNHDVIVSKEFIQSVLESSFTETINQFEEFVAKHRSKIAFSNNVIERLSNSIKSRTGKEFGFDYKYEMIRLFLQKMVTQLYENIPNDLCLVLLGGPFIGKTEFFKRLLPPELQHLFSVQAFKGDKDSKRDAARYLLILDDEFRGLKLATSEALKSQLSLTTINLRVPYGRKPHPFKRIASYCAVSNERFILKDPTGNRRLICFWVDSIDHEMYESVDKIELIMEAYNYYLLGHDHNLSSNLLKAINQVSAEFELSTSAEELLLQYYAPGKLGDTRAKWMPVSEIILNLSDEKKLKLSDYDVGRALRKLNYHHKYLNVNGSKLLCWLVLISDTQGTNFENDVPPDVW
jgi:hypothetical protein